MLNKGTQKNRGDTIVEALIALAIAAFAVGIAYATANRSLDQAITARERNQALNLIENQITDLRIRFTKETADNFKNNFGYVDNNHNNHFCLNDTAAGPGANPQWLPYMNNISAGNTVTTFPGGYVTNPSNVACERNTPGEGATYYIDITTTQVPNQAPGVNDTLFQVSVRWERIGGGPINQSSLYFRPNGKIN